MKIELILSKTYICQGKVYNKADTSGKNIVYEVSAKTGRHLLAQSNERNVPYFRKAADGVMGHLAPRKSVTKGGIPIPVEDDVDDDADSKPDPAEDDPVETGKDKVPKVGADGDEVEDDEDDDDDDDADDADEDEESVTV